MSDNDTTTPDAEQPTTVAQELYEMDVVGHTNAKSKFKSVGVTYNIGVWIDSEESADDVARIAKLLQRNGYRIDTIGTVEKTGNIKIQAEA